MPAKGQSKYGVPYRLEDGSLNPEYQRRYYARRVQRGYKGRPMEKEYRQVIISFLLERDGRDCRLCLQPLGDDVSLDHIIPVVKGGTHHHSNIQLVHLRCNSRKKDRH